MDAIKELLSGGGGGNPGALLPDVGQMMDKLEIVLRIAVMAGPLCLLGMGLVYLLLAPREANHRLGYRFYWGMSSVEVWQFTQRVAGLCWTVLGLVLTVVMAVRCNGFVDLEPDAMLWSALKSILWELGIVAVSILAIDVTVIACFDAKGYPRRRNRR